jgi:hypothetical protein
MTHINIVIIVSGALLVLVAIGCAAFALHHERRLIAVKSTPTSRVKEVRSYHQLQRFGQPCEVAGIVESDDLLAAPISGAACVAYHEEIVWEEWEPQPEYMRRRAEEYGELPSFNTKVCSERGTETNDQRVARFWIRDATGRVLIDPLLADLDLKETDHHYDVTSSTYDDRERRTTRTEYILPLGHQALVLGCLGNYYGEPIILRHPSDQSNQFLISYRTERQFTRVSSLATTGYFFAAGIFGGFGVALVAWQMFMLGVLG